MGLLRRAGAAAAEFGDEFARGLQWNAPFTSATVGGVTGGMFGAMANPDNPLSGAATGAGIGAGLMGGPGMVRALGRGARGAMDEWRAAPEALEALKREALKYVRDPQLQQRIFAATTPDEVKQIAQFAVMHSRSRMTEGGF